MLNNTSSKSELYTSGEYLDAHPSWHVDDSKWKARQILKMTRKHHLAPRTVCEVGCGAGEILRQLQDRMSEDCAFFGYEISPQALELCERRSNDRLHFTLADITQETRTFDLLLFIDVIEHIEDCLGFLRRVKDKGLYKMFHIPLEFTAIGALRRWPRHTWDSCGHIHHFMKDTALRALHDTGYTVLDSFYTPVYAHQLKSARSLGYIIKALPLASLQGATSLASEALSARLFGGFSLLVLAR
ncbi:MAG: class I SAM-dependent methyltransferase [Halobacteriota archaeon]